MLEYRLQCACLLVVLYISYSYFSHKRLQTGFRKIYIWMLVTAIVYMVLDIATSYVIDHPGLLPHKAEDIINRMFYFCMNIIIFIAYRYVLMLVGRKKHINRFIKLVLDIPFAVAMALACFAEIHYYEGPGDRCAFGAAVTAIGLDAAAYITISFVLIILYKNKKEEAKLTALMRAFALTLAVIVLQAVYPYADICSICVMMMILMVYLALGDPKEYADTSTGGFNRAAFIEVLDDRFSYGTRFAVMNVVVTNWSDIMDQTDGGSQYEIFAFARKAAAVLSTPFYKSSYNSASYILPIEKSSAFSEDTIERLLNEKVLVKGKEIELKAEHSILVCPSQAGDHDKVIENINHISANAYRDAICVDRSTGCLNRNAYENDLINANARLKEFASLAVVMIDVNGLKATNDTWGHRCGDELLQSTAALLKKHLSTVSRIYRIGGDEFLCIASDVSKEKLEEKCAELEAERASTVMSFGMTVSFASGTAYLEEYDRNVQDVVKRADRLMYKDKISSGKGRV